jgi:hypothetical protein
MKKDTTSTSRHATRARAPCFEVEGEVAVEARQASDHHPPGAGAAGEGEEQQEAEETAGAEAVADRAEESRLGEDEEAWPRPCRRRHLEDVLIPVAVAQVEQTKRWTEKTSLVEESWRGVLCSCGTVGGSRRDGRWVASQSPYYNFYAPVCLGFFQLLATKSCCRSPNAPAFIRIALVKTVQNQH